MSWLSAFFGFILVTLATIWASEIAWDNVADKLAQKMNVTSKKRLQEAHSETYNVEKILHQYYYAKVDNTDTRVGANILKDALQQTVPCLEAYYEGSLPLEFQDCMHHVISRHMNRLKNELRQIKRAQSGASRLQIWH